MVRAGSRRRRVPDDRRGRGGCRGGRGRLAARRLPVSIPRAPSPSSPPLIRLRRGPIGGGLRGQPGHHRLLVGQRGGQVPLERCRWQLRSSSRAADWAFRLASSSARRAERSSERDRSFSTVWSSRAFATREQLVLPARASRCRPRRSRTRTSCRHRSCRPPRPGGRRPPGAHRPRSGCRPSAARSRRSHFRSPRSGRAGRSTSAPPPRSPGGPRRPRPGRSRHPAAAPRPRRRRTPAPRRRARRSARGPRRGRGSLRHASRQAGSSRGYPGNASPGRSPASERDRIARFLQPVDVPAPPTTAPTMAATVRVSATHAPNVAPTRTSDGSSGREDSVTSCRCRPTSGSST